MAMAKKKLMNPSHVLIFVEGDTDEACHSKSPEYFCFLRGKHNRVVKEYETAVRLSQGNRSESGFRSARCAGQLLDVALSESSQAGEEERFLQHRFLAVGVGKIYEFML